MFFTVADARTLVAQFVEAGACPSSAIVLSRINEATQRLMNKAAWWNLQRRIRFYTINNTITLPREVSKVLKVNTEGYPARAFHQAYEFLEGGPGELCPSGGADRDLLDLGEGWPIFFDVPAANTTTATDGGPCKLIAFSTAAADTSLSLTIWGVDQYSADICSATGVPGITLAINRWAMGVEGTITGADISATTQYSSETFKEVTGVAKPVTAGHICLYTYEPTTKRMFFLAKYHPDETRPSYHRYRITNPAFSDRSNVLCLVRLGYVPMIRDTDILLIQNISALKLMVAAIREENDRNLQNAEIYEQKAYRALNEEQQAKQNHDVILQVADDFGMGSMKNLM